MGNVRSWLWTPGNKLETIDPPMSSGVFQLPTGSGLVGLIVLGEIIPGYGQYIIVGEAFFGPNPEDLWQQVINNATQMGDQIWPNDPTSQNSSSSSSSTPADTSSDPTEAVTGGDGGE
jgi:hypothetical protein